MKKINIILCFLVLGAFSSCKKYMDINTNPNQAISATPDLILPQALVGTANIMNGYNTYGSQLVGYAANAGGYGGFGTSISYAFTSADFGGLWASSYDNLEDYQAVINAATANMPTYTYFNAVAKIMKVVNFELLVDAYNDVPYKNALLGANNLTPTYDKATDIYKDLASQLDSAIIMINAGATAVGVTALGANDVVFGGNMTKWKQLANTVKLRLLINGNGKVTFANNTFSSDGFLTTDALINPGFTRDNGKQSPKWNSWAYGYTGTDANKAWMPTTFVLSFYKTTLVDSGRGAAIYYTFAKNADPKTKPATNQLGYENTSVTPCPSGSFWYPGSNRTGASAGNTTGVLKGPNAGFPLLTAAESYFLQAEGALKGINAAALPAGNTAAYFNNGIAASYYYLYLLQDGLTVSGNPAADAAAYLAANNGNYLANYSLASSAAQQLESIITQKYIAMNFVNSEVAWNDYRRTHYPTISGTSPTTTFASVVSESTRPDRLPTRILYPNNEGVYNTANVPQGIDPFSSLIFWAQ